MRGPNNRLKKHNIAGMLVIPAVIFMLCASGDAAEISGVKFSEVYRDEGVQMSLRGTGLKTMIFFKAFAAGFYQKDEGPKEILDDVPKRIEVEYFVRIPGKKLNNYTIDRMKDNTSDEEFERILEEVELMGGYFVDLKPGDRFSLTYIPGVGTKFAHNNQLTGIVKGKDFARALFAVWIGEKPFDENLKNQILGVEKDNETEEQLALQANQ